MTEAHRYKAVTMISAAGATIGYDPHGPDVVMAAEFDRVTAERDALQQRLNAADQRIDELERGRGKPVMKLEAERLWGGAGEYALSFVKPGWLDACRETGGEFLLYAYPPAPVTVAMSDQLREAAKMIGIERMPPMEYDEP